MLLLVAVETAEAPLDRIHGALPFVRGRQLPVSIPATVYQPWGSETQKGSTRALPFAMLTF